MKLDHLRTRRDLDQATRLVADSFSARHADLKRIFLHDFNIDSVVAPRHIRIVRHAGELVSLIVIYQKPIQIGRAKMKMGGLGFVCSNPKYRGKGFSSKCLSACVKYMKNNRFHLSALFGIDRFYGRAGYVGCLPEYRVKVPVGGVEGAADSLLIQPFGVVDLGEVLRIYTAASAATPLAVLRTRQTLKDALLRRRLICSPPKKGLAPVLLFREKAGSRAARGYLVWRDGNLLEAGVAPGDEVAASCILAWLRDRRKEALEKELVLPHGPKHPLTQYALRLNHSLERSFSWTGGGMGRVVDIPAFLDALHPELEARLNSAGMDGQCHVHFTVSDGHSAGETAAKPAVVRHTLRLGAGHQFMLAHRPHYWLRVECPAQTLLQLAVGCLPLAALSGLAVEGERNLLPILFPESAPEIFPLDHF